MASRWRLHWMVDSNQDGECKMQAPLEIRQRMQFSPTSSADFAIEKGIRTCHMMITSTPDGRYELDARCLAARC